MISNKYWITDPLKQIEISTEITSEWFRFYNRYYG